MDFTGGALLRFEALVNGKVSDVGKLVGLAKLTGFAASKISRNAGLSSFAD